MPRRAGGVVQLEPYRDVITTTVDQRREIQRIKKKKIKREGRSSSIYRRGLLFQPADDDTIYLLGGRYKLNLPSFVLLLPSPDPFISINHHIYKCFSAELYSKISTAMGTPDVPATSTRG